MKAAGKLILCFVLMLSAVLPFAMPKAEAATSFKDIGASHRAYEEIMYLSEGEIVHGSNGNYKPNASLSRAEAMAMIGRALNLNGTQRVTSFKDVGINNFASGYIQSAVDAKIVSGYGDGTFRPNGDVTRGEMAVMISKAFGYDFGNTASGAAKALLSRGIAQGLNDGTFGSSLKLTRGDFAVFLARAINHQLRVKSTITYGSVMYVNATSLNVRSGPNTNYKSVGALKKNASVSVAYKVGTWSYIKTSSGTTGFVLTSYLTKNVQGGGETAKALASQTIVIDPGHGGKDPGAVGYGLQEKDVVLQVALKMKPLLQKTGINIVYTRETDKFVELSDRVAIAGEAKGNTFVSIHANAFANSGANGTETYYYSKSATNPYVSDSKLLAEKIQTRLVAALGTNDRGDKNGNYKVIRENTMPAVLVELAFISNPSDNKKLGSAAYQQKAANAIYYGVLDYYKEKGYNVSSYY